MSQLEFDVLKKILKETERTNELLEKLTTQQQPKTEVVSDKPINRGNRRGNQKQP